MTERDEHSQASTHRTAHIPGLGLVTGEIGAKGRISSMLRRQSAAQRRHGVSTPERSEHPGLGVALAITIGCISALAVLVLFALAWLVPTA